MVPRKIVYSTCRLSHLNHDPAPTEQFLHLVGNLGVHSNPPGPVDTPPRLILLELQVRHGPIDTADLTVRPTLDPVSAAEALQRRYRDVHRLSHPHR